MQEEKFMEIYTDGEDSFVDIVNINNHIYKRFFSSYKFNNEYEIDKFIDAAIIDENCQIDKQYGKCTILKDMKTGEKTYYIYRSDLMIEKVVLQEITRISVTEINEKLSVKF